MPTSFWSSIPAISAEFEYTQPRRVLDIGVGRGKYGLLAREYINSPPIERLDGVEVHKPYLTPIVKAIYDHIYNVDIVTNLDKISTDYDMVLLIDIIEHVTQADGYRIIEHFKGAKVIVSTPRVFLFEEHPENHFEEHISHWTDEDFARYDSRDISTNDALIKVLSP